MLTPDDCFWKDELKEPPQTRESMDTGSVSCVVQVFRETAARGLVRAEEGIPDNLFLHKLVQETTLAMVTNWPAVSSSHCSAGELK